MPTRCALGAASWKVKSGLVVPEGLQRTAEVKHLTTFSASGRPAHLRTHGEENEDFCYFENLFDNLIQKNSFKDIERDVYEGPGTGTLACQARGYKADGGIVAEPTKIEICPAITGAIYPIITINGKAAHSTMFWKGVNALEKAMFIVNAVKSYRKWQTLNI